MTWEYGTKLGLILSEIRDIKAKLNAAASGGMEESPKITYTAGEGTNHSCRREAKGAEGKVRGKRLCWPPKGGERAASLLQWIASYASSTRIRTALTVEFALPMGRSYSLFRARGNNNKPAATEDSNPRQAFQLREAQVRGCGQARAAQ